MVLQMHARIHNAFGAVGFLRKHSDEKNHSSNRPGHFLIGLYEFRSWIKLRFQLYKLSLEVTHQIQFCFTTE